MENEIWKDIEGFEGLYMVSSFGRIKSLANDKKRKEKILQPRVLKSGYLIISLNKKGKKYEYYLHRIVANAFIPNPDNLKTVDHIDMNKSNNIVENLRWLSLSDNVRFGNLGRKHSDEAKRKISESQKKRWKKRKSEN